MPNPMDQVISKGAGLTNQIKARLDGLVGVFNTLAQQHGEAGALLKRAKGDVDKRVELWPTIRASLRAHEQGELREVYPVLGNYPELQPLVKLHDTEASQLSQTIDQMDALDPRSAQFETLLNKLIGLIEAHVEEEENQIFPTSQTVIGEDRAKELEPRFVEVATQLKQTELRRGKS
jgi:hypothetical protein